MLLRPNVDVDTCRISEPATIPSSVLFSRSHKERTANPQACTANHLFCESEFHAAVQGLVRAVECFRRFVVAGGHHLGGSFKRRQHRLMEKPTQRYREDNKTTKESREKYEHL